MPQHLFLLDQKLLQLRDLDPERQRTALFGRDPAMPTAAHRGDDGQAAEWCIRSRTVSGIVMAGRKAPKRVALITEAGLGKSTNMAALQSDIARAPGGRQLPFLLRLESHASSLRREIVGTEPDVLLGWMTELVVRAAHPRGATPADRQRIRGHILRDWADGRITLLLDGLDHVAGDEELLQNLGEMLRGPAWCNCPVVISGRPEAFKKCWDHVIVHSPHRWRILKIAPLAKPEIDFYLGGPIDHSSHARARWFDAFPPESQHLLGIPRFLQQIGGILRRGIPHPPESLDAKKDAIAALNLRTGVDVYYKAYFHFDRSKADQVGDDVNNHQGLLAQGLLKHGWAAKDVPREIKRLGKVLAAVAFFMLSKNSKTPEAERLFTGVNLETLKEKLGDQWENDIHGKAADLGDALERLRDMNNHVLDFLVFGSDVSDHFLVWHDRTVQAFFAALWAVCYASPAETATMLRWRGLVNGVGNRHDSFDEFWQFSAEMPDAALMVDEEPDHERWKTLFERCYSSSTNIRGLFDGVGDKHEWLQWHRYMVYYTLRLMKYRLPGALTTWRQSFQNLQHGTANEREIYREVVEGFQLIRAAPRNPAVRGAVSSDFRLHQWPVTNRMYEVFDPLHREERWKNPWIDEEHPLANATNAKKENKKHPDCHVGQEYCPVVNVTWYDAWCFAAWCGDAHRLPTEWEWEHACRSGSEDDYYFGDDESMLKGHAWYDENSDFHTHPVPQVGRSFHQCSNKLYDMHGNICEWCDSLYEPGILHRVLRGGSWDDDNIYCRAGYRRRLVPVKHYHNIGFRLAATRSLGIPRNG